MIIIQKDKSKEKKATVGCQNPYKYAERMYEDRTDACEDATVGCAQESVYAEETSGEQKKEAKSENSAFAVALRILQAGANSRRMLREKLVKKGFSRIEAEDAVEEAVKAGLLHEKRLFFSHAEFLARRKYYGKSRLRMALLQKFDRETVDAYFEEVTEELDFTVLAKELVMKNANKSREALIGKLKRNGYNGYEIREALTLLQKDKSEDPD